MLITRTVLPLSAVILIGVSSPVSFPGALWAQDSQFRRADSNGDSRVDLSDAVFTLRSLFLSGGTISCSDAADANDDGSVDISDPLTTLSYLFTGGASPPAPGVSCGSDPTADALGCEAHAGCRQPPVLGQSEFETRSPALPAGAGPGRAEDAAGGPAPPTAGQGAPPAPDRLIEESEIYKLSGDHLFVLNRYRGLQVIDLTDLDSPKLVGKAPIFGNPQEMYVRDDRAFVIVSDYYTFWRDEVAGDSISPHSFHGSQLRILDISEPTEPTVVGGIDLEGEVSDSRIVGDVMYLVSQRYPWHYAFNTDDVEDKTEVVSVSIADPADIRVVDRRDFPRNGWERHVHVTPRTIYLASSGYVGGDWNSYQTRIRAIDISDPAGGIQIRGETVARGRVQDRWCLDEHQGVLRVASGQAWGNGDVYLTTFSVTDLDRISQLGQYTLHVDERLTAARFDGINGYLVSYRNIDPLFHFDLSNPAKPALLGELEMSGWLDFIVPMGDRLVALGHEDLVDPSGGRLISLAVSLIDVSRTGGPRLISRVAMDGAWGAVPGSRDDFAKVFRTLPDQGLILFPFHTWSRTDYRVVNGVQLIDHKDDRLTKRGLIRSGGWVERGIPHGQDTVLTLSSEVFQVMDIADRDSPRLRGRLDLARNVQEFAALPPTEPPDEAGDFAVQLSGDWYSGDTAITVTPLDDPNAATPTAQVHVPAPYGRLFMNGSMAYLASVQEVKAEAGITQTTVIQAIDLTDPRAPKLRGSVSLPEPVWMGSRYWSWGWGDEVVQVNGSTLAFHRFSYSFWGCLACDVGPGRAGPVVEPPAHLIYLVDLKDPDRPVLASTVKMEDISWAWGLKASGSKLYLSVYRSNQTTDGMWSVRYYLRRIDVSDPAHPVESPEVNIPGMFVDASPDGQYIYTQESWWDQGGQTNRTFFYALALIDDRAFLQSKVEVPGYMNNVLVKDNAAFTTTYWSGIEVVAGRNEWRSHSSLLTIDLANPQTIRLAGKVEVPMPYAYLQKVESGRAFLGSWIGIFVFQVGDIENPAFEEFFRTQGWSQDIVVRGNRAYVPSGYYGVQILELKN